MPDLYRKVCEKCDGPGRTDVTFEGFDGGVVTGADVGGEIIPCRYRAYIRDHNELVPLPNPGEDHALDELGVTWHTASIQGRLVWVINLICTDCGAANRKLSQTYFSGYGCLAGLVLPIAVFAGLRLSSDLSGPLLVAPVLLSTLLPNALLTAWVRLRHRNLLLPFRSEGCSECGSKQVRAVSRAVRKRWPCPRCGETTLHIQSAGMS